MVAWVSYFALKLYGMPNNYSTCIANLGLILNMKLHGMPEIYRIGIASLGPILCFESA